jgi:hypothetical protein
MTIGVAVVIWVAFVRYYVANAPVFRWLSSLAVAAVIVCGALVALGIGGPRSWHGRDSSQVAGGVGFSVLNVDLKAQVGKMRTTKHSVILQDASDYTSDRYAIFSLDDAQVFAIIDPDHVSVSFRFASRRNGRRSGEEIAPERDASGWSAPDVLRRNNDIKTRPIRPVPEKEFRHKTRPLVLVGENVRLLGLAKGRPNQKHANHAEAHAYHRGNSHYVSPKGGLPLRYKITLVVLVFALFVGCLCCAILLIDQDKTEAGVAYLFPGVFGVMATVGIDLPFIFG